MKTPEAGAHGVRKSIPLPRLITAGQLNQLVDAAASPIEKMVGPDDSHRHMLRKSFSRYSSATLTRIADEDETRLMATALNIFDETIKADPDETYVNDLLVLSTYFTERNMAVALDGNYLIGARKCRGLAPQGKDGSYPEERRGQLAALMTVTDAVVTGILEGDIGMAGALDFSAGYTSPVIASEELRELVLRSSDIDRELITRIIEERNVIDPQAITGILKDISTGALSSGVL